MTTDKYKSLFTDHVNYIKHATEYCRENKLRMLCVTHHPPTNQVFRTKPMSAKKDKFKSLYYSNLDELLEKDKVHTWVCGHVHSNFDFVTDGGTRVIGNQKGKPKDKIEDFCNNFVIEL